MHGVLTGKRAVDHVVGASQAAREIPTTIRTLSPGYFALSTRYNAFHVLPSSVDQEHVPPPTGIGVDHPHVLRISLPRAEQPPSFGKTVAETPVILVSACRYPCSAAEQIPVSQSPIIVEHQKREVNWASLDGKYFPQGEVACS